MSTPSEEICVAAHSSTAPIDAARFATADPRIAAARRALVRQEPLPPVPTDALVRYVPPEPTRDRFAVRAATALDPSDPGRAWVAVEALTPLGRSAVPLHLTVLLDLSESMSSSPVATLPVLQDRGPDEAARGVQRDELARAVLSELVERLPSRAEWSLVAFSRNQASIVLLPTPGMEVETILRAISRVGTSQARSGSRTPLDEVYGVAGSSLDGCADNRILLVTDDHARLDPDPNVVSERVATWAARGIELWTLSLGNLGQPSEDLAALTEEGHGVLVYADTLSEAVEPVSAALRATGTALRAPGVEVSFGPAVKRWRRADGTVGTGADRWALPERIDAGWRQVALYTLELVPGADPASLAVVASSGGSPVPGEWTVSDRVAVPTTALVDAPAFLRHRVFAAALGDGLQDPSVSWDRIDALGRSLVREDGAARELQGWVTLLAARPR